MAKESKLELLHSGKVRDIYALESDLLFVATDRISTFDVIHPTSIPNKGKVLTGLSVFWFKQTQDLVNNHLISYKDGIPAELRGRALRVKRLEMLPIECVVRGYLAGSGWSEYEKTGQLAGFELPDNLLESDRLPEPLFTPSTKAKIGHDQPINFDQTVELIGSQKLAESIRDISLKLYLRASQYALQRGIILADTKFEFGLEPIPSVGRSMVDASTSPRPILADEICTPDSSRFWPLDKYRPGGSQASFDKQPVRDWASHTGWDKTPPAPEIPQEVVRQTSERYIHAYERLTGEKLEEWLGRCEPV